MITFADCDLCFSENSFELSNDLSNNHGLLFNPNHSGSSVSVNPRRSSFSSNEEVSFHEDRKNSLKGIYIDTEDIVNKEIFDVIRDVAVCNICYGLLLDPVQCIECDNCFCKGCIKSWREFNECCPYKCEEDLKESRLTKRILSRLIIKCANCSEEIPYSNLVEHYNKCKKPHL